MLRWLASLALLLGATIGHAPLAHAQTFPPLSGRVVDSANILPSEEEAKLTQLSDDIEKASSRQFVVATVPDLQGYPIEDFGYKLGRAWGIGQQGANNGIILLVAPNDRKVRIEVGTGLEPVMTDALASVIVNNDILPRFKAGDLPGGVDAGAQAIAAQMKLPLEAAEQRAKAQVAARGERAHNRGGGGIGLIGIFWIVVLLFVVLPIVFGRARGRRYRGGHAPVVLWGPSLGSGGWGGSSDGGSSWGGFSGGGGGGGGFSGGGGSFGGGGASGGW